MKKYILLLGVWTIFILCHSQEIEINTNVKYQEIEGFGASDAWSTEVLKTFPDTKKNTAARWLFNATLKADQSANGIGLSIWRFALGPFGNMPAGSSNIPADYLDAEGNYVWDVNPGKQWFLDKAFSYGCDQIGAWSACILPQLRPDGLNDTAFEKYGNFLADILNYYERQGIRFKYIAPVNEPQYAWVENVKWTTENISNMTRKVCESLIATGNDTPVMLGESADWTNLYDKNDTNSHWARNQVDAYFDSQSKYYLGDLSNLIHEFGVHSYWTDQDSMRLSTMRSRAKQSADKRGLKLHQTEWSLLSNPPIEGLPSENVTDMDIALITSKVIHCDLHYAGVSSWCFWEAFGAGQESHFHLIQTDEANKNIKSRKNLWALGNYSLFIRPGYIRVHMDGASFLKSLMGTSYISPDNKQLVSVYTNMAYDTKRFMPKLTLPEGYAVKNVRKYQTSSLLDLQKIPTSVSADVVVPARSVVTYIYDLEPIETRGDRITDNKETIHLCYDRNVSNELSVYAEGCSVLEIYGVSGILYERKYFIDNIICELPKQSDKCYIVKIFNQKECRKTYIMQ